MKFVLTFILTAVLALGNNASAAELTKATKKKQATEWQQICQPDKKVPAAWKSYQKFLLATEFGCDNNFYRYVNYPSVDYKGSAAITPKDQLQDIEICKIKNVSDYYQSAFQNDTARDSYSKMNIQVLPLETLDYKSSSTPQKDYGHFFKIVETWLANNSDNGFTGKINIPENYLPFKKFLGEYKEIGIHGGNNQKFLEEVMTAVDSEIDFKETYMVIVLVPPQVDPSLLATGGGGYPEHKDGNQIDRFMVVSPFNFSNTDRPQANTSFLSPVILIHQFQHGNWNFGDYLDTGGWGLMSLPTTTDLLGWQKYISGFYGDHQVRCLPTDMSSISVLTPSVAKTIKEKLAVIPISKTKAIVLESMRAGGFNYKLPKGSEGLLVYEIDSAIADHSKGIAVISNKRGMATERLMGATLKKKEFVVTNGFKITVTESGTFGDVVKVEKAS